MSVRHGDEPRAVRPRMERAPTLSGALVLVGLVVYAIQRMALHPSGAEDDHEAIFTDYAASDVWVATHFAELVLVLMAFAGLLVLCRALHPHAPYLAALTAGAVIVTSATWTALQGVDGVTLKQAVDAWAAASGTEQAARFGDAENIRWIEWGLQSYFRVLLGIALLFLGAAMFAGRVVPNLAWRASGRRGRAFHRHRRLRRLRPASRATSRTPWLSPSRSSSSPSAPD